MNKSIMGFAMIIVRVAVFTFAAPVDVAMTQTSNAFPDGEDQEDSEHKEPGAINGGLLPKDPTGEHPLIVIDVPSVEEHLKKIESSGGKTVMPVMKIGDYGLYARVSDTEGNVVGIWQTLKQC